MTPSSQKTSTYPLLTSRLQKLRLQNLLGGAAVCLFAAGCGGGGGSANEAGTQSASPLARQGAVASAAAPKAQELVTLVCLESTQAALTDSNGEFSFPVSGNGLCGLQSGETGAQIKGLSAQGSNSLVSPLSDLGVLYIAQKSGYAGPEDFNLMLRDERFREALASPQVLAEAERQVKDYYFNRYGLQTPEPVFFINEDQSSARRLLQEVRQMIQQWAKQGTLKPNGLPDDFDRQQIRVLGLEAFRKDSLDLPSSDDIKKALPNGDTLFLDKPAPNGVVIDGTLFPAVEPDAQGSIFTPSTGTGSFDRPTIDKPVIGTISLGNQMHSSRPATAED